jgi:hypothetical protein
MGLSTALSTGAVLSGVTPLFPAIAAGIGGFTIAIIALAFVSSGSTTPRRTASEQRRTCEGGDSDTGALVTVGGLSAGGKSSGVGSAEVGEASGGWHGEGGDGGD